MIRIDHLFAEQYQRFTLPTRSLLIEQPQAVDSSSCSDADVEPHGYPVTRSGHVPKRFPPDHLNADTLIVTCGMLNFEESNFAKQTGNEIIAWNGNAKIERGHLDTYPHGAR